MWFDALILCILIFATIRGAMKGIVWQLAVIASLVFCFFFAGGLSQALAPHIGVEAPLNRWISMFILYTVFSFLAFGAARLIRDWMEEIRFVEFDKHLGAVLGFVKGAIFCLFVTFFAVTLSEKFRGEVLESQSGRVAALVMDRLHPVMPAELHDVLEPYIHRLDQPGLDLKYTHDQTDADHDHDHGDHDHGDSDHKHDDFDTPPDPFAKGSATGEDVTSWISKLPRFTDSGLERIVRDAFEHTSPEDRSELYDILRKSAPAVMKSIANQWQDGKPVVRESAFDDRQRMLDEIGDVYGLDVETRDLLLVEVTNALAGVPAPVATATIRDWHADVLKKKPDPDPETDSRTRLDARIIRQLSNARVPIHTLGTAIQSRLRDAERR